MLLFLVLPVAAICGFAALNTRFATHVVITFPNESFCLRESHIMLFSSPAVCRQIASAWPPAFAALLLCRFPILQSG